MEEGKSNEVMSKAIGILGILFALYLVKSCIDGAIDTANDVYDGAVDIAEEVVDIVVPDIDLDEISNHEAFVPFCKIMGSVVVSTALGVVVELSDEFDDLSRLQKEGVKLLAGIIVSKGVEKEKLNLLCKSRIAQQTNNQAQDSVGSPGQTDSNLNDATDISRD